jgi:hypothetical protein
MHRAIILPILPYGCETYSLTLREDGEYLRKGCSGEYFKGDEVTESSRIA